MTELDFKSGYATIYDGASGFVLVGKRISASGAEGLGADEGWRRLELRKAGFWEAWDG